MSQRRAHEREKRRVNQRLLHAVAQLFHRPEMLDEAAQDVRERAAGLSGHHEVDIQRRENPGVLAQRLRKAASIHQGSVQAGGQLPERRLFQTLDEDAERLVEGHAGGEQISELLREEQPLPVRQLRAAGGNGRGSRSNGRRFRWCRRDRQRGGRRRFRGTVRTRRGGFGVTVRFNLDRDAAFLLDELDGGGAVTRLDLSFDEFSFGVAGAVRISRHGEAGKENGLSKARILP